MSDFWRDLLIEERAKTEEGFKKECDLRFLIGYYGNQAERTGNAELAALVREMTEVLDGTWQRPEGSR
jgi:hypothetical protein